MHSTELARSSKMCLSLVLKILLSYKQPSISLTPCVFFTFVPQKTFSSWQSWSPSYWFSSTITHIHSSPGKHWLNAQRGYVVLQALSIWSSQSGFTHQNERFLCGSVLGYSTKAKSMSVKPAPAKILS